MTSWDSVWIGFRNDSSEIICTGKSYEECNLKGMVIATELKTSWHLREYVLKNDGVDLIRVRELVRGLLEEIGGV